VQITNPTVIQNFRRQLRGVVSNFGAEAKHISEKELIERVLYPVVQARVNNEADRQIDLIVQVSLLMLATGPTNLHDFLIRLDALDESVLLAFFERNSKIFLAHDELRRHVSAWSKSEKAAIEMSLLRIRNSAKAMLNQTIIVSEESEIDLRLVEIESHHAGFAPMAGQDCLSHAATASFESGVKRNFFVVDSLGIVQGALRAQIVASIKGPSLLVDWISGARLSSAETEAIITGLFVQIKALGVNQVLVPMAPVIAQRIPYSRIRAGIERFSHGSPQLVRAAHARHDVFARPLILNQNHRQFLVRLEDQAKPLSALPDALLAIQLLRSGHGSSPAVLEIMKSTGLNRLHLEALSEMFMNPMNLLVQDFIESLLRGFMMSGVRLSQAELPRFGSLFLFGVLNAPDAFEPDNLTMTRDLILRALRLEWEPAIAEALAVNSNLIWRDSELKRSFTASEDLLFLLFEQLDQLLAPDADAPAARQLVLQKIMRRSPRLVELYGWLSSAKTASEYLQRVPPGVSEKNAFVHQAVRSSFEHFLKLSPSGQQVQLLSSWLSDLEERRNIYELSLKQATNAERYLELVESFDWQGDPAHRLWSRRFLAARWRDFQKHAPSADQINRYRRTSLSMEADLMILSQALQRVGLAHDFLLLVELYQPRTLHDRQQPYFIQLARFMGTQVEAFSKLEPNVHEINRFRRMLMGLEADLKVLELNLPKMTRAADFLSLAELYLLSPDPSGVYRQTLAELMRKNQDLFFALEPSPQEISRFRRVFLNESN